MNEALNNSSQKNVIEKNETGPVLGVENKNENSGLSSEEIAKRIIKEEDRHQKEMDRIKVKYENSNKEDIDKKILDIGLKREDDSYNNKITFLNKIPVNNL